MKRNALNTIYYILFKKTLYKKKDLCKDLGVLFWVNILW